MRICCINFFSVSKVKRDRDVNMRHSLSDRDNLRKIVEREVDSAVRGEKIIHHKLAEAETEVEARGWEKRHSDIAFQEINQELESQRFQVKQVHGQIKLREVKLACMENRNWEIGSVTRIMQEIAKKLKIWEEFVAKKLTAQDRQELMNCLCIKRWILRLWVNWWLRFGNYKTK